MRRFLVTLLLFVAWVQPLAAQDDPNALLNEALATPAQEAASPVQDPYSETMWIFFVGTGLIALAGFGITQWKARRLTFEDAPMHVVHSLNLSPKHRLVVVELDGKQLLLGVSDAGIHVLNAHEAQQTQAPQAPKADLWLEALRQSKNLPVEPKTQEHSGLFAQVDARPQTRTNRESDSVLIGLKSLESKARVSA